MVDGWEDVGDRVHPLIHRVANTSEKQHAWTRRTAERKDRAEVRVRRDQDAVLFDRERHDLVVGVTGQSTESNVSDVMTSCGESVGDLILKRLIDKKLHAV